MRAAGHAIGLHCDKHLRHSDGDLASLRDDTQSALEQLATVGVPPGVLAHAVG